MSVRERQGLVEKLGLFARVNLIGDAPVFRRALSKIASFTEIDATVLIAGESGTGKELAARTIHYDGPRRDYPFIPVNCATLSEALIENELFGHERGAYTHAVSSSKGLVEQATGGTLFLDEVDCLSDVSQSVLLRFLDNLDYRRLGDQGFRHADTRVIAATNEKLGNLVARHEFRKDLYYRLNVLKVTMPPLRERAADVPVLAEHFLNRLRREYDKPNVYFSENSIARLTVAAWPGNVRELQNTVLRSFLLAESDCIEIDDAEFPDESMGASGEFGLSTLSEQKTRVVAEFESRYLRQLMMRTHGNITQAARLAGKERRSLGRLLKKYGIDRADYDARSNTPRQGHAEDSAFE